jgi:Icc-related predicted phosphoesterase
MNSLQARGLYSFETTPDEVEELKNDKKRTTQLFIEIMKETMRKWLEMMPQGTKVIVNPGNDDCFELDEVIAQSDKVIYPLGKVVEIGDKYKLISNEWTNPTLWKTYRECSEEELAKKLEKEFERVDDYKNLICNFHAPPYGTSIDLAPKLDGQFRVITRFGTPSMEHVGSKAVRNLIEKYQPLLGLHGHIHESGGFDRLNRTICLNPGSEYDQGILRGYIINLPDFQTGKIEFWRIGI